MQIECLIRRVGTTVIHLDKDKYIFFPVPGSKSGEDSTSVCEINKEEHVKYLLTRGSFRQYDPTRKPEEKPVNPLLGFSVEKHGEAGYILVDKRKPKEPKYAGTELKWQNQPGGLKAFPSEIDAFNNLREEVEMQQLESKAKR